MHLRGNGELGHPRLINTWLSMDLCIEKYALLTSEVLIQRGASFGYCACHSCTSGSPDLDLNISPGDRSLGLPTRDRPRHLACLNAGGNMQ
jgi:hypothetical protein